MANGWTRLFPDADHRFRMSLRPGDAPGFWQPGPEARQVLAERRHWLSIAPTLYTGLLPEGGEIAREAMALLAEWSGVPEVAAHEAEPTAVALPRAATLLEPDFVILSAERTSEPRVLGGAVIFPSSWSLVDKLGLPMREVHGPVPGLEATLSSSIGSFFDKLEAGTVWERDNWGLSGDAELNHHPSCKRRGLTKRMKLDAVWLRLERQFVTRLPVSGGLVFGIRVTNHRLDEVAAEPKVAGRLARTLETMDEAVAEYKGLREARRPLVAQLRAISPDGNGNGR